MKVRYEGTYHRTWKDDKEVKEAKRNWAREISTLDQLLVKNGIEKLFERYPEWPPNLNGFINLCKEKRPSQAMYKPGLPRLERKASEENIKVSRKELADIRAKLR